MKKELLVSACLAMLALPLAAQEVTPETVVATVDGTDITMTHVLDIRRKLPEQYHSLPAEVLFPGIIDQLIQQRVLAASVEEAPLWLDEALANEEASILAGLAVAALGGAEVSDEEVTAAYEAQFGGFEGAQEFNASHILVDTEDEARAIIEQLGAGAGFAALAQEFSTGPSGPRGGELGWFGQGMMVPAFEEAVLALEVGGVSPPVETQFGWHVVTLNDTRRQEPPALADIRSDLEGQIQSQRLEAGMAALMESAEVTRVEGLDPGAIDTLSIFGQ